MSVAHQQDHSARQQWMGTLSKSDSQLLASLWQQLAIEPEYQFIRKPEIGLTMVRGRTGGSGSTFNLGEMTLCRCAVRLTSGTLGVSYVAGRDSQHAIIAALADALLQEKDYHNRLQTELISPLADVQQQLRNRREAQAASTKVDFFTLVRGED